jgi:hypothetical protein
MIAEWLMEAALKTYPRDSFEGTEFAKVVYAFTHHCLLGRQRFEILGTIVFNQDLKG